MTRHSPSEPLITGFTQCSNPETAARELYKQLHHPDLDFVLFFCSANYNLHELGQSMSAYFSQPVAGCTTAGEVTSDGYMQGSISAIGFSKTAFSVKAQLLTGLDSFTFRDAQEVVSNLLEGAENSDYNRSFAITLFDGLSSHEETVLMALNAALGAVPNFGGSAGDDIHLSNTHVFFNGRFYTRAAVVVLVTTDLAFEVFSTHHLQSEGQKLVVTRSTPAQRTVHELNGKSAVKAYADAIGLRVDELTNEIFALKPLAVKIGNDYFARSIQKITDDGGLMFYCAIENGIVLNTMLPGDMLVDLQTRLEHISRRLGSSQMIIACDCFLRRLEIEYEQRTQEVSELYKIHNVVGFNSYGEQYGGVHVNQTFTGVCISQNRVGGE